MAVLAVIPSRYGSKRFPGKPLALIEGVPLVRRVTERVVASGVADLVVMATDDERIAAAVAGLPVRVMRSDRCFRSGTDRVAAAVRAGRGDKVLNVQGDEAFADKGMLLAALQALEGNDVGTVAAPLGPGDLSCADTVKVSLDERGRALAFSRTAELSGVAVLRHLGVYAFTADSLARFSALPTGMGERSERLEQLRVLERGWRIGVGRVASAGRAINSPRDLERGCTLEQANRPRAARASGARGAS